MKELVYIGLTVTKKMEKHKLDFEDNGHKNWAMYGKTADTK